MDNFLSGDEPKLKFCQIQSVTFSFSDRTRRKISPKIYQNIKSFLEIDVIFLERLSCYDGMIHRQNMEFMISKINEFIDDQSITVIGCDNCLPFK